VDVEQQLSPEAVNAGVGRATKRVVQHVRRLEMRVAELEAELQERDDQIGETNTAVLKFGDRNRPLPSGASVGFNFMRGMQSTPDFQVRLRTRHDNMGMGEPGDLEVAGVDGIMVIPQASNVVTIRLVRRR
jgi:hypothetical protein